MPLGALVEHTWSQAREELSRERVLSSPELAPQGLAGGVARNAVDHHDLARPANAERLPTKFQQLIRIARPRLRMKHHRRDGNLAVNARFERIGDRLLGVRMTFQRILEGHGNTLMPLRIMTSSLRPRNTSGSPLRCDTRSPG